VAGIHPEFLFTSISRLRCVEPRRAPMTLERVNSREALLHQPPTPFWGLESWTRFTLTPPYYIDVEFTCVPRKRSFWLSWIGLLWASYINGPMDKSMYFLGLPPGWRGAPVWLQLCTQYHGRDSTVRYAWDTVELGVETFKYVEP